MSGAEVAGLVLAILPLCVSALERHRDELRPFKSLFRYHKEIQRSVEDLGIAYIGFVQTIHLIFEEAGVADPEQLDRMVKSFDPDVWTDRTLETRLMDYFGKMVYEKRYQVVVRRIFEGIKDIAGVLGYEIKGVGETDTRKLWQSVQQEQGRTTTSDVEPSGDSSTNTSAQLKARAKYFVKSGQLGLKLEELERNIERLSETAEKAQKLSTARAGVHILRGQSTCIKAARDHLSRLYRAITTIKSCQSHPKHCLSLRLDPPTTLKPGDKTLDSSEDDGKDPIFVLAFAPEESSETWNLVEIQVMTAQPEITSRKVAFALPGPTSDSSQWRPVQDNLCNRLRSSKSKTSMRIDPFWRLQEKMSDTVVPVDEPDTGKRLSLKQLLKSRQVSGTGISAITTEGALNLGYTLALAFIQLYATPWMTDDWCTDDVVFLRSSPSADIDPVYIPVTVHQQQPSRTTARGVSFAADDARRLLGLAVILLEVCTKRPIEECRRGQNQESFGALEQFTIVRRHYRDKSLVTEPPCFQEVIKYCLECYSLGLDLDLDDPGMFQQLVDKIIAPIQRDLKSCLWVPV